MDKFEFDNQRPDEEIILVRRRHPWVLWKSGFFVIVVLVLIVVAYLVWGASRSSIIISIVGLVLVISSLIGRFFVYNNDVFIITNQRIINIDQSGFFSRVVSEAELVNIQNVTYEIRGPVRSLLNFGNITVQTAGNAPGLVLKNVENPHFAQERIVSLQKKQNRPLHIMR